ncbi:MAG: polysaccharide biosynthesis tyrosine autokinase, partial [Dehalococcoidia bacterium]|nr:polysaccharide biosynthesis tyrosine autokinase [Dehalococcoidia bacterium]
QEEFFDFRAHFRIFLRRWWILTIGVVVAGLFAFTTFEARTPAYASTAKLFVQGGSDSVGISASDLGESRVLSQLYGDLATTRPVLDAIAANENVPFTSAELRDKIDVDETRSFLEITVVDGDASTAAVVANVAALTLITELSQRQIAQIAQFQNALAALGLEGEAAIVAAQAANLPVLSVAEEAVPAGAPISGAGEKTRRIVLGLIIGFMLSAGVVMVWSALDDTVKTEDELAASTGLVTLGSVPRYRQPLDGTPLLMTGEGRHHPASEAYYIIRANVDYALASDQDIRSLLVTGPGPGEGKSTFAANMAVAFAKEGNSVILVDTDLRKPVQHVMFGIDQTDTNGVSDVLSGKVAVEDALSETEIGGLKVLTAGHAPNDPSLILRGEPLVELKKRLHEIAEIVVYDSPPVLVVSDPLLLGEGTDLTILVSEAGVTKRRSARRGAEALSRSNNGVLAAVLTKQRTGLSGYGYGYTSYYGNGHVNDGVIRRGKAAARAIASRTVFWKNGRHPDA